MGVITGNILPGAEPFLYQAGGKIGCLLIHGYTGSPYNMKLMGEYLWEKGITALGVRLKGHGTFPGDMKDCTYRDWIGSAEEGLKLLKNICSEVYVAGLSMGGAITLYLAAKYPQEIAGIIPMCAPAVIGGWRSRLIPFAPVISRLAPYLPMTGNSVRDPSVKQVNYKWAPSVSLIELLKLIDRTKDAIPLIGQPALVVASRNDPLVPESSAEYILNNIASGQKQIMKVDNSYHVVTLDYDKDIIFRKSEEFIKNA